MQFTLSSLEDDVSAFEKPSLSLAIKIKTAASSSAEVTGNAQHPEYGFLMQI